MMDVLLVIVLTSLSMVLTALVAYGLYLYSLSATKTITKPTDEKKSIYACGEVIDEKAATVSDVNLYVTIWNELFKPLYDSLRKKVHTGILNDWFFWMFLLLIIAYTVIVLLGGVKSV